jgi:hypothetical protein
VPSGAEGKDEKKPLVSDGDPTEAVVSDGTERKRTEDKFTVEARERRAKMRAERRAKKAARAARKAERDGVKKSKKELEKERKDKEEANKKIAEEKKKENSDGNNDIQSTLQYHAIPSNESLCCNVFCVIDDDMADKKILEDTIGTLVNPVDTKPSAAFSSSDEKKHSKMGVERTVFRHQRNLQVDLALPALAGPRRVHATPYATIDVVFNHRRMYANLQQPDPEIIEYQLTKRDRWAEFKLKHYREYFGIPELKPFFTGSYLTAPSYLCALRYARCNLNACVDTERALVSVLAPQQEVDDLQLVLAQRVQDTISTFRDFKLRMETSMPIPLDAKPLMDCTKLNYE